MKFELYAVTLVFGALGTVVGALLVDQIQISSLGSLTGNQIVILMNTILWFLVAVGTWFGAKRIEGDPFGIFSINFFLTWISCNIGVIIGALIQFMINGSTITLTMDLLTNSFFLYLPLTLAPTATATLGYKEKNS